MSIFLEQPLPISVATVADLATSRARTVDGGVVQTAMYSLASGTGGNEYIYHLTGRSLITVDGGFYIAGPGSDDYFEARDKSIARPTQFGAIGDDSTVNTTFLQACYDAAVEYGSSIDLDEGVFLSAACTITDATKFVMSGKGTLKAVAPRWVGAMLGFSGTDNIDISGITFDTNMAAMVVPTSSSFSPGYDPGDFDAGYCEAISLTNDCYYTKIHNCKFINLYMRHIDVHEGYHFTLDRCDFQSPAQTQNCDCQFLSYQNGSGKIHVTNNQFIVDSVTSNAQNAAGIIFSGINAADFLIDHNYFENVGRDETGYHRIASIDLYANCHDARITNNTGVGTRHCFINVHACGNAEISNNIGTAINTEFFDWAFIQISGDGFAMVDNEPIFGHRSGIRVLNNTLTCTGNSDAEAINVSAVNWQAHLSDIIVQGNTCKGFLGAGSFGGAVYDMWWIDNTFRSNSESGFCRGIYCTPDAGAAGGDMSQGRRGDWHFIGNDIQGEETSTVPNPISGDRSAIAIPLFYDITFTADSGTDILTANAHGLADGAKIRFIGDDIPEPLVAGTIYYVRDITTNTFKVEATLGGGAIDITDNGTGSMWYSQYTGATAGGLEIRDNTLNSDWFICITQGIDVTVEDNIFLNGDIGTYLRNANIAYIGGNTYTNCVVDNFEDPSVLDVVYTKPFQGTVSPNGVLAARPGAEYVKRVSGSGIQKFIKDSGTGNTGWLPFSITGQSDPNSPVTTNLELEGNGSGTIWEDDLTYISSKILSGDFDVSFKLNDLAASAVVGVTTTTEPVAANNWQLFEFAVYYHSTTEVRLLELGVETIIDIGSWGSGYVRMVRTGSTIQLYINDVLVGDATDASFTTANMFVGYTSTVATGNSATIYNDDYVAARKGANLTATLSELVPENQPEVVTFSATPEFRFNIAPSRHKSMVLTANVTSSFFLMNALGMYYIKLVQDGTGSRTFAWDASIVGTPPTLNSGADEVTVVQLYFDGTDIFFA